MNYHDATGRTIASWSTGRDGAYIFHDGTAPTIHSTHVHGILIKSSFGNEWPGQTVGTRLGDGI